MQLARTRRSGQVRASAPGARRKSRVGPAEANHPLESLAYMLKAMPSWRRLLRQAVVVAAGEGHGEAAVEECEVVGVEAAVTVGVAGGDGGEDAGRGVEGELAGVVAAGGVEDGGEVAGGGGGVDEVPGAGAVVGGEVHFEG